MTFKGSSAAFGSNTLSSTSAASPSAKPGPRNRAVMFVLAGPQQGAVFQLHGASVWIGRSSQVDVNLNDEAVSTRQTHVTRRADGFYVQDGGSRNGTFLNDERVEQPRRLVDGDHLSVGDTILKFSMLDELEEHALTQLFELTIRDPLTRSYNRRYLTAHLRSELAFAARQGMPLSLLLIDIDHFKHVNDNYGHRIGDVVLQLVAASIQRMLRPYDVLCRYGGEEFVVVARDTSQRNAEILAQRIRHHIEAMHFDVGDASASVTVSVGVTALSPRFSGVDGGRLLQAVDEALYAAKAAGRNRVRISRVPTPTRGSREEPPHTTPPRRNGETPGTSDPSASDCRPPPVPRFD
jgi:diguanylate cyclase (GGDEF)-like protein